MSSSLLNRKYTFKTVWIKVLLVTLILALLWPMQVGVAEQDTVTRGEFIKAIIETLDVQLQEVTEDSILFNDVNGQLAPYIEAALRLELTNGMGESTFAPDVRITKEQAYVMYMRALNVKGTDATLSGNSTFSSRANVSDWARATLISAEELNLFSNTENMNIKAPLTKAELEQLLVHYQQLDKIVLVHLNDLHGRVLHNEDLGEMGLSKIATLIKEIKNKHEHVFLFDIGDTFHGTNYVNLNDGLTTIEVANKLGVDAMVPGNHEFNYGLDRFNEFEELLDFPFISANILEDGETVLDPYIKLEKAGKSFAVVALTSSDTPIRTHPDNVEGIQFEDEIETAKIYVEQLKDEVDHIIFLNHIGYGPDRTLASQTEGIDVILGGHSHTTIETPINVNGTYIAQAFEYGKALGVTKLLFQDEQLIGVNGYLMRDDASITPDQEIDQIVQRYKADIDEALEEVVGSTDSYLDGERETVRTKESNLGNVIADALRSMVDADIALQNGGGIRASIEPGDITLANMVAVLPFINTVVKIEQTGDQIKSSLEHSISNYPEQNGAFLQVSGLEFTFDPSQPVGNRVVEVTIAGEELDLTKTYTVATNDFMASGGDGYEWMASGNVLADTGELLSTALINYMKTNPSIPENEERIKVLP
ncbi:5'-nucleotidase C-terminal domain-containing protein [Bacillus horti]|uniref:2',3'-cyclic-nucleotide 2'-phosphodiesterase (5'-nucleotidase family) n=1 Tax=Caldalkalibacillus horti TaxID=77523 RepID=A0ABT9VU56_9BACI|nr:5'-nucleotidase C-terminal domain-containing protein [Bacillus horti]MDQ0164516.1 2',3'-cyclic-nucleotide 2'-phosphodiesterase (5'-nucleotidase family) [Bacillus horti]